MFGSSLFQSMGSDPFFGDIGGQMRQMQQMHEEMMSGLMGFRSRNLHQGALENGPGGNDRQVARRRPARDPFGFPMLGGDLFNPMGMFNDMSRMISNPRMEPTDPNTHFYSSSSVMSFSNTGSGAPKVYQATSSTRQAPGGVRETRKMMRDSTSGMEKVHHSRHIGERGHVVNRQRNVRTGDAEENVDYLNLDEEEAPQFHREWQQHSSQMLGGARSQQRAVANARSSPKKTRAPSNVTSSHYAAGGQGGHRRRPRNVTINSKAEVM